MSRDWWFGGLGVVARPPPGNRRDGTREGTTTRRLRRVWDGGTRD